MAARSTLPVHGNYTGYYTKRPTIRGDPRLALLPADTFVNQRVLDVGCNEGLVTCEIGQSWRAKTVTGVDIDETLIRAAWRRRRAVWSTQQPDPPTELEVEDEHPRKRVKREPEPRPLDHAYFPVSCAHMFGPLPIPDISSEESDSFPHNVAFRVADFASEGEPPPTERGSYDVILALSITKWVHVNTGDEGLRRFFRRIHNGLSPNGKLILEPQGWEGYAKARRINKNANKDESLAALKLRPTDFEVVLREIGFGEVQHIGVTGEGGFRRAVDLYVKSS